MSNQINTITITVSGSTGTGKSAICFAIKRALHDLGFQVQLVDDLRVELQNYSREAERVLCELKHNTNVELREVNVRRPKQ